MRIGFLGMGLMGSRMAARLLQAGFDVGVWNRTATACNALFDLGAQAFLFADAHQYDVLALCLADDNAVKNVIEQLHPHLKAGQIVVDFSSLSVALTQLLAQEVLKKDVHWIDAPVSGGVMGAQTGELVVFAGGNAQKIEHLESLFAAVSKRVTRMGDVGTGQVTKICNQLIVAASSQLISEAVALAQAAGVDANQLAPALAHGFADSKPLQILAPRMAQQVFTPVQWKCQTLSKDLQNALTLAKQVKIDIPVATFAQLRYISHINDGYGEHDLSTLIKQDERIKPDASLVK